MFIMSVYSVIICLFILFILYQIYFYSSIYNKNNNTIKKFESFQNTLTNIDANKEYKLDDKSLELLLDDYNKIKNNI